jgi:hypothetical protein
MLMHAAVRRVHRRGTAWRAQRTARRAAHGIARHAWSTWAPPDTRASAGAVAGGSAAAPPSCASRDTDAGCARRATCSADLNAPVGYDKHGYGYRSAAGEKIHDAKREPFGAPFAEGDVVGMYICLGESSASAQPQARAALPRVRALRCRACARCG